MDARPLQDPDRSPLTALYLGSLLAAFDADPLDGESFAMLLQSDLADPTDAFEHLDVVARRQLPPTRFLRSGALTVDPILLRASAVGAAWRAERAGAAGAVYHAAGSGPLPIASGLPVVVTILDLAPWEMPDVFARSAAGRFGRRLRAQLIRDAAAVIVGTEATARATVRHLHVKPERIRVVPMAPRPEYSFFGDDVERDRAGSARELDAQRERLGLPERYLVYPGRYDARQDLATLLEALVTLAAEARPEGLMASAPWPPRVVLVDASPDDRAALARAAAKQGIGHALTYAPSLSATGTCRPHPWRPRRDPPRGLRVGGAPGHRVPVCRHPGGGVVRRGVARSRRRRRPARRDARSGPSGRRPRTIWADDRVHDVVAAAARDRAATDRRTWADVAQETRALYAEVGIADDTEASA